MNTDILKNQIKFSGIIVTYNEERRLNECLKSLTFCSELLVIDLGSKDNSIEIAKRYNAKILHHPWVQEGGQIRHYGALNAKYDWIIFPDPDEVFPTLSISEINEIILNNPQVGLIGVPWRFYFMNRPLKYTFWGEITEKYKWIICHRKRVKFPQLVHQDIKIMEKFSAERLKYHNNNFLEHYWIDSLSQLFEKHLRYIQLEGEGRYKKGKRFTYIYLLKHTVKSLYKCLFDQKGIRGGLHGIFLSFFYAWYECSSLLSLRTYQKRLNRTVSFK